jgi:hypothetical protein
LLGYASRHLARAVRFILALSAVGLAACGQTTPKYHIAYSGADPETDISHVQPTQIDLAAEQAAALMGTRPESFAEHATIIYLHDGPIQAWGDKLYGDTDANVVQTQLLPCLFDDDSALMHELVHTLFYQARGDAAKDPYDNHHIDTVWHAVEGERAALKERVCP